MMTVLNTIDDDPLPMVRRERRNSPGDSRNLRRGIPTPLDVLDSSTETIRLFMTKEFSLSITYRK